MQDTELEETVGFRRRAELPGIEIRDFENSSKRWRCFAQGFEFLAPRTWRGEIVHRRRRATVVPGMVFCVRPEEVFTTTRILSAGGGSSLTIDPEILLRYLAEHDVRPGTVDLKTFVRMSPPLSEKLHRFFRLMNPATAALELQSSLVDLMAALLEETVMDDGSKHRTTLDTSAAGRIRECLHWNATGTIDLERLAAETRLSRFQVLRLFKQRYGLPPHAYHLCVRIGRAQRALRAGASPAHVAADQGFFDQSHLNRHFKQLVGVTPVAYARALH
jgi:AraC-like DNA-binding protein